MSIAAVDSEQGRGSVLVIIEFPKPMEVEEIETWWLPAEIVMQERGRRFG